jgi:hypothetical protein
MLARASRAKASDYFGGSSSPREGTLRPSTPGEAQPARGTVLSAEMHCANWSSAARNGNDEQRPAPEIRGPKAKILKTTGQRPRLTTLTRGNVEGSHTPGAETALAGVEGLQPSNGKISVRQCRSLQTSTDRFLCLSRASYEGFGGFVMCQFLRRAAVSSSLGTESASRARRNTRSLAVFARSARARCSYSGIELPSPDSRSCLKRSSAFSLEVMRISFALNLRNAAPLMWSLLGQRPLTRIVPKRRRWSCASQLKPVELIQVSPPLV